MNVGTNTNTLQHIYCIVFELDVLCYDVFNDIGGDNVRCFTNYSYKNGGAHAGAPPYVTSNHPFNALARLAASSSSAHVPNPLSLAMASRRSSAVMEPASSRCRRTE